VKPTIDLYRGKKIIAVVRGEESWEWGIKLQGDVEIRNKDVREEFRPMDVVNRYIAAFSLSPRDTTLHLSDGQKISFAPTKYAIFDPRYGSESYPQWPEELEEMGIPAIEGGEVSGESSPEWKAEEARLVEEREAQRGADAAEFLREDDK
jgi:hypothetical protein